MRPDSSRDLPAPLHSADNTDTGTQVAKNTALIFIGKAFSSVTYIVFFVILSRAYSQEDYGTFRQIWLISKDITVGCLSLGIPIGVIFFLTRLEENQKRQFSFQSIGILAIAGAMATLGILVTAPLLAHMFNNPLLAPLLKQFSLFPALFLPMLAMESVFLSFDKSRYHASFLITSKSLFLIAMVLCVQLEIAVSGLLNIILIFSLAELIVGLYLVHRFSVSMRGGLSGVTCRQQFIHSAPIGFSTIVNVLNVELDKLIVSLKFSVSEFALYANGAVVVPFIGTFAGAASSSLMPHLMRRFEENDVEGLVALWCKTIVKIALIFYPLLAFLFVFTEEFLILLFTDAYRDSAPILRLYLVAQLPKIIFFGPFLMAVGKRSVPLTGAILTLSVNAIASWYLVSLAGLTGPAIATLVSVYLVTAYYLFHLGAALDVRKTALFPFRHCLKVLCISLVIASVLKAGIYCSDAFLSSFFTFGALYALYSFLVFVLLRLSNVLTRDDVVFLRAMLAKITR